MACYVCAAVRDPHGGAAARLLAARDSAFLASFRFVDMKGDTVVDPTGSLASFRAALDSIRSASEGEPPRVVSIVPNGNSAPRWVINARS